MGLTVICDNEVTGSATTNLTTDTFSLTDGELYLVRVKAIQANGGTAGSLYYNSDTTDSNYRRGLWASNGSRTDESKSTRVNYTGETYFDGYIIQFDGYIYTMGLSASDKVRAIASGVYNLSESSLTQLQLISDTSNDLAVGTRIQVLHMDVPLLASATVSGSPVTTLSCPISPAIDATDNKSYLVAAGAIHGLLASTSRLYINNNTTASNYERGESRSNGGRHTDDAMFIKANGLNSGVMIQMLTFDDFDSHVRFVGQRIGLTTTNRYSTDAGRTNNGVTSITSLDLQADVALGLAANSFIKIWEIG